MKELGDCAAKDREVFVAVVLDPVAELLYLEDSIAVGEEAEEDADEEEFEVVSVVAFFEEEVVEAA